MLYRDLRFLVRADVLSRLLPPDSQPITNGATAREHILQRDIFSLSIIDKK
jgi:hypothetical protein